eukprot:scaffold3337_cov204-Alexandrium_tamarense.AAC.18
MNSSNNSTLFRPPTTGNNKQLPVVVAYRPSLITQQQRLCYHRHPSLPAFTKKDRLVCFRYAGYCVASSRLSVHLRLNLHLSVHPPALLPLVSIQFQGRRRGYC